MALDHNTKKLIDFSLVNKDHESFKKAVKKMLTDKINIMINEADDRIHGKSSNQ